MVKKSFQIRRKRLAKLAGGGGGGGASASSSEGTSSQVHKTYSRLLITGNISMQKHYNRNLDFLFEYLKYGVRILFSG